MSALSQFVGGVRPVKALITELIGSPIPLPSTIVGTRLANVVCTNAGQLYTVVSVAGAGSLDFFSAKAVSAGSQALRMKITIDGVVAYDQTGAAFGGAGYGFVVLGALVSDGTNNRAITHKLPFGTSLLVEVSNSAAGETVRTNYIHEVC